MVLVYYRLFGKRALYSVAPALKALCYMRCDGRWRREISFFTASKISADAKGNSHEAKQKRDPSVI